MIVIALLGEERRRRDENEEITIAMQPTMTSQLCVFPIITTRSILMPTRQERIAGGLWGLLVGDALGVPYEFNRPDELPSRHDLEMIPPEGFRRSHVGIPPGTWSDDGAQALALLDSLLLCERLDPDDLGRRLVQWYREGRYAVENNVFDIGIQTKEGIERLQLGIDPLKAGLDGEFDNGNGSLMRVLPLLLWHSGSDRELVRDAELQSRLTHGHPRAQVCCALYTLWGRSIQEEEANPWESAVTRLREIYSDNPTMREELEEQVRPDEPPDGNGSGYVVDSLHSARLVMQESTYRDVVQAAVALGDDTDTTACIAGGLAGLRDGIDAIPEEWMEGMRGKELVERLLSRLTSVVAINQSEHSIKCRI